MSTTGSDNSHYPECVEARDRSPSSALRGNVCRVHDGLLRFISGLGVACLALITLFVTYDVIARKLGYPTDWAFEVSGYLLQVTVYLTLCVAERRYGHIKMDYIVDQVAPQWRAWILVAAKSVALAYVLALVWYGSLQAQISYVAGMTTRTMLAVPLWALQFLLPLGCALLAIEQVLNVCRIVRSGGRADMPLAAHPE